MNAQLNVKQSFTNFFQKRAKFPKFKSKKNNVRSYTINYVNNSIRVEENKYLVLPKLKRIKLKNWYKQKAKISKLHEYIKNYLKNIMP